MRLPDTAKPTSSGKDGKSSGKTSSDGSLPLDQMMLAEVLESTLWSRQLGPMSEEVVAALVCQIFEGIRWVWWGVVCGGKLGWGVAWCAGVVC